MKKVIRRPRSPSVRFTAVEHLKVQLAIERRAHQLWLLRGCRLPATLQDWLEAEREVTASFICSRLKATSNILAQGKCHPLPGRSTRRNRSLNNGSKPFVELEAAP